MNRIWIYLGDENNRRRLTFIGSLFSALVIAGWVAYTHIESKKKEEFISEEPSPGPKGEVFSRGDPLNERTDETTRIGKQTAAVMVKDVVELKQDSNVKSALLCVLMPSDYILPLNIALLQNSQWCQVRVVDSQTCIKANEGYIPSVALTGNCGF